MVGLSWALLEAEQLPLWTAGRLELLELLYKLYSQVGSLGSWGSAPRVGLGEQTPSDHLTPSVGSPGRATLSGVHRSGRGSR